MDKKLEDIIVRRDQVMDRMSEVRQQLQENTTGSVTIPNCLLQTELETLVRQKDALDREIFHMSACSPIPHDSLCETVNNMLSDDWKNRLRAEWEQLCIRMDRLDTFRDKFRADDIDFVPKWSERLLCDQLRAMRVYRDCLLQYAKLEGIELDTSLYDDSYIYEYYFAKEE